MFRLSALVSLALIVAACGFQLRGAPELPPQMARTYIDAVDRYSLFYQALSRELSGAGVKLVETATEADAIFHIFSDETDQRVLSVSARNVPREYEVYYSVSYSVQSDNGPLLELRQQTATRDYTYDETQVLGKSREEELLREAIARDLARIVLIQLSAR